MMGCGFLMAPTLPNIHKFPRPQPPSPPPHAPVDAEPIRAQQGRKKRQRCSPVSSVADSNVSGDGWVVMTSFKFPQESPAHESVPLSLTQRQGTLNVGVRPFTFPGLGGIDIGAIKKVALQAKSPVGDGNCHGNGDDDGDGDIGGNDVDDEHELPIPVVDEGMPRADSS
ncbi:hypothetical protein EDB85DRAFT_244845 [Lactarius pseudohatsudake]|nr:hypothetical protein EDB85DRAFT_244845 [Lactarius pseudohatsudake]